MDERSLRKAIFLDRDNTIIKDDGYFHDPNAIVFIPNAAEGLLKLQQAGFLLIVISNQSGIGREFFPESDAIAVNKKMIELLQKQGVRLEKTYYCPHSPEANCLCRKPKPFMILKAAEEFGIDLSKSFFIGDHMKDMEAGRAARTATILIDPTNKITSPDIDISASNISEAAEKIISHEALYSSI